MVGSHTATICRNPYYRGVSQHSRLRIVVAKPGLDGHDRGIKIVARALRDAGHEVVYLGLRLTAVEVVETAIQEDAHLIGLSVLSGAHMTHFKAVLDELEARDADDILVFGGGIVPDEDLRRLEAMGVRKVFTSGTSTGEITEWVRSAFSEGMASPEPTVW
jgi:methylmalonyl-CoA mutase, C-terminal domain